VGLGVVACLTQSSASREKIAAVSSDVFTCINQNDHEIELHIYDIKPSPVASLKCRPNRELYG
jgi:hypothetical protein